MHDLRWIRENRDEFKRGLQRRGLETRAAEVLELDRIWRMLETEAQEAQAERNRISKEIGASRHKDAKAAAAGANVERGPLGEQSLMAKAREAAEKAQKFADSAAKARQQIDELVAILPNLPASDVPDGPD